MEFAGLPVPVVGGGIGLALWIIGYPYVQYARGAWVNRTDVTAIRDDYERQINDLRGDFIRQLDDANHERDEWRAEGRIKDQHIAELTEQNTMLLREISPLLAGFLEALRAVGVKPKGGDDE